jgi:nucleoid DNA-binding protein
MEKYLIELLETNNRVIVPDLGAFIIRQQEPQELVFNDLLAFNDGMLTSHIKQQEGISMSKAQVKIEEFVDQVKKVLTKGDIYHLENLGYLKMDDSSKIEFSVTKFPTARAEVVSASTLKQEEDLEASRQPEKDSPEETPVPAEEKAIEEEAPVVEVPEEEDLVVEVPEEEAPVVEVPEEEDLVLEVPEEEAPEKETLADEGAEWKAPEGNVPDEEIQEETIEVGSFTLEDQTAEIEVDASEDTPLVPDAEEPPFLIEEQEKEEEKKVTVVGTSQARLEAAAEAAVDDENNAQEFEQESVSTTETSIPYYVEREKRIRSIWPWVGGSAALIIILLVAAWFFFPNEVNRIFAGKSAETVTTEEQVSDDSSAPGQETTSGSEEGTAAETDAPGSDTEENAAQEAETDQTGVESVEETDTEPEPEPETPPAGQTKKYYIVAGMFSIQTNAEDLVNTLKAKGYDAELFGRHGNLYAVSFSSHVSKTAAVQELNRIREQINLKAWLLYY